MKIKIQPIRKFMRNVKELRKSYRSIDADLEALSQRLETNPLEGDLLMPNVRKVRMPIASKNKGKSGGARVITYFDVLISVPDSADGQPFQTLYLLTIYEKGQQDSISNKEIIQLLEELGF